MAEAETVDMTASKSERYRVYMMLCGAIL